MTASKKHTLLTQKVDSTLPPFQTSKSQSRNINEDIGAIPTSAFSLQK